MTKIKIGLFGFGVVGQGIYEVVRKSKNAHAEIVKICVRDPKKPRKIEVDPSLFTTSVDDILDNQNINLVVEVIDDADAAYNIVKRAMLRGIPVVSGSKTMLAKHLPELIEIQKTRNVALLYDASSCGSIPVIRNLEEYYDNDLLLEVKGILNGSSNYILSRVFDHKDSYANALAQAQALGFAESDPSFDIEGYDSLFKLVIITVHALGTYVAPERIFTYGISTIHDSDIQYAREKNVKIKLVAQVVKVSDEHFTMFVMPEFVTPAKYIYSVDDEYNGVVIRGECYDRQFMFGKGAGSLPTASAVLGDLISIARQNNKLNSGFVKQVLPQADILPPEEACSTYYMRFMVKDDPGVLRDLSGALSDQGVSIAQAIQKGQSEAGVPLVFMTHEASVSAIRKAVETMRKSDFLLAPAICYRVMG